MLLYWQIGRDILARQAEQGWGAKVIDRLAHDLRTAFPRDEGLFAAQPEVHARVRRGLAGRDICAAGCCTIALGPQPGAADKLTGPKPAAGTPPSAIEHNWSRNVLVMQIETRAAGAQRHGRHELRPAAARSRSPTWRASR